MGADTTLLLLSSRDYNVAAPYSPCWKGPTAPHIYNFGTLWPSDEGGKGKGCLNISLYSFRCAGRWSRDAITCHQYLLSLSKISYFPFSLHLSVCFSFISIYCFLTYFLSLSLSSFLFNFSPFLSLCSPFILSSFLLINNYWAVSSSSSSDWC